MYGNRISNRKKLKSKKTIIARSSKRLCILQKNRNIKIYILCLLLQYYLASFLSNFISKIIMEYKLKLLSHTILFFGFQININSKK